METKRGDTKYTIDDLSRITGLSRRTIRYYVQEGLVAPPAGRGRGGFYYDSHLLRLRQIKSLQGKKITLSEMATVLKEPSAEPEATKRDFWVRYEIIPGVELHMSTDEEAHQIESIPEIVRMIRTLLKGDRR